MNRILITGGAGFIGSHLARHLHSQGHYVHLIDDLSTGLRENVADLLGDRCVLQVQKVSDAMSTISWLHDFDAVYHLAAAVGVQLVVDEPVHCIETNIKETGAVLKATAAFNLKTLIASTSEVYGKSNKVPFQEDDDMVYGATIYNRWSYAMTKAIDEYLAMAYHQTQDLPIVCTRFFNTVGPGQLGRYGMVIPRFLKAARNNEPITIYGDGEQSRCFCHVTDIVQTLPKLLEEQSCHGRVFNVGSEEEVTINELADRVIALTGSKAGKRYIPYEEAFGKKFEDLNRRVPDLSRLKSVVDFNPTHSLDDILKDTNDWMDSHNA